MEKEKKYVVISPDGFTIHPTDEYISESQVLRAFADWKSQYEFQGYYSSVTYGRIQLYELDDYCEVKEI
jgi:hypothetical protein